MDYLPFPYLYSLFKIVLGHSLTDLELFAAHFTTNTLTELKVDEKMFSFFVD